MSSSGAPRKIEGMKSMNVWVIAIAVMKIIIAVIGNCVGVTRKRRIVVAMRFMWMPGIRPVIVPARRPSRRARVSSSNIGVGVSLVLKLLV